MLERRGNSLFVSGEVSGHIRMQAGALRWAIGGCGIWIPGGETEEELIQDNARKYMVDIIFYIHHLSYFLTSERLLDSNLIVFH